MNNKAKILVVDDNSGNLILLCSLLKGEGYITLAADSGELALESLENNYPDLILMDIQMAGIDGFEMCRRIKQRDDLAEIPIIFLSVAADIKDKLEGFRLGAVDYITKPFQKEELLIRIKNQLDIYFLNKTLKVKNAEIAALNKENISTIEYLKIANEKLEESARQLAQINADKDRFISILGHDLKSPFNNILGLSELLIENVRNTEIDEIGDIANHIYKSAKTTNELLEDILLWARTQKGSLPFNPQNLSLAEIYGNVIEILKPVAFAKDITLTCNITDHIAVNADTDMLKTILLNLVSNAVKFTNKGGRITFNAEQNSGEVLISVADNGVGIAPDDFAKLFNITEVLTTKGTAGETGTGLGLLLCKDFIEKHGGKIWVESEADKGSIFKFTLPSGYIKNES